MITTELIENFFKSMEQISLRHEAQWVLEEMKSLCLSPQEQESYLNDVLRRRQEGEPLAYIFGHWVFRDLTLKVGAGVLIPRPETEELVDHVLKCIENISTHLKIVDAGAGSGCLGLGIYHELHKLKKPATLTLIENSVEAQKFLETNVQVFLETRSLNSQDIQIFKNTWSLWPQENIDLLLSNPPYISGAEWDEADPEVRHFEPHAALYPKDLADYPDASGPYRELLELADRCVGVTGWAAFELGASQARWIEAYVRERYPHWQGQLLKDMAQKDRFWIMQKNRIGTKNG